MGDDLQSPTAADLGERGLYQRSSPWNSLLYVPVPRTCHILPGRDAYAEFLQSGRVS